ncbi:hypothetical protein FRC10_005654 [Ceratobasidium sp. 414]|nr:hypothetical protein FRC10_005654 [Ceratobasidium sp. 414]
MSTKRSRFTTEGAGSSRVVVQIEHIDETTPSSKKPRAHKDVNRRRKRAPKTIEFQLNGSLNSHTQQYPWQEETPTDSGFNDQAKKDENDPLGDWREDFSDVAQATEPVEPVDQTGETDKTAQRKRCMIGRGLQQLNAATYVRQRPTVSTAANFARDHAGFAAHA